VYFDTVAVYGSVMAKRLAERRTRPHRALPRQELHLSRRLPAWRSPGSSGKSLLDLSHPGADRPRGIGRGGLALAAKSLAPVNDITTRTRRITAENLDQTLPIVVPDDEIGRLTSTINDMIRRLHDSFAQIRQFSADASHELRTPLTIVRVRSS